MKFTIRSIQLRPSLVLTRTDSYCISRLGFEINSIVMTQPDSSSKTNIKPDSASACEFRSLPTYSIFITLNSVKRFFAIAKYFTILVPRALNFPVTWLTTNFESLNIWSSGAFNLLADLSPTMKALYSTSLFVARKLSLRLCSKIAPSRLFKTIHAPAPRLFLLHR